MKKIIILLCSILLLCGCNNTTEEVDMNNLSCAYDMSEKIENDNVSVIVYVDATYDNDMLQTYKLTYHVVYNDYYYEIDDIPDAFNKFKAQMDEEYTSEYITSEIKKNNPFDYKLIYEYKLENLTSEEIEALGLSNNIIEEGANLETLGFACK